MLGTPTKPNQVGLPQEQLNVISKIGLKIAELGLEATFVPPVSTGPIVSIYRFLPQAKTKVNHLENLAQDIAVALGVEDVLVKRMPGESAVGFFVPNEVRRWVEFKELISSLYKPECRAVLPLLLGTDHTGKPVIEDLVELPHLLIAGSTGAGKSTLLAAILTAIVYKVNSNFVKLVLSDTKGVEFGNFIGLPHMLFQPADTPYKTLEQLDWCVEETERRLKECAKCGAKNITQFNDLSNNVTKLPRIVVVIDELADLLQSKLRKECEQSLSTLVQRSRAAGLHIVAATQRPSVNVVIGSIKANFSARLSLRLPSEADSRTILNTSGAEHLLSPGDALYISPLRSNLTRIHAPRVETEDIRAAVDMAARREEMNL